MIRFKASFSERFHTHFVEFFSMDHREKLDAIILAGGRGTRLREIIGDLPKVLAPVNNRPFLDVVLSFLNKCGCVQKVVIAVGYLADKVMKEYADRHEYDFEILFSEEKELLGTGGAIRKALSYTKTADVLALNGDSYVDVNIADFIETHRKKHAAMTIVLTELQNTSRYGRVKVNGGQRIVSFEEKTPGQAAEYVNAGMYLFKRELIYSIQENKTISLEKELLPIFLEKGVYGHVSHGRFMDIGVPDTYSMAQKFFREAS
jgi:D-glycero-alpha-D-manno-heptose 1-phosphate guanylyltransferase